MWSEQLDLKPDDTFFFMHVPKTAGTSLTSVLLQHFDARRIWPSHEATSLMHLSDLGHYQYVGGHFPGSMVTRAMDKRPVTVTMLRDPVQRYRSNHEHLRRVRSRGNEAETRGARLTLEELVADENRSLAKRYRNRQAAFIACDLEGTPFEMCRAFERYLAEGPNPEPKTTQARLAMFDWVGIAERFEDSLRLLSFKFGWRPTRQIPLRNVAPSAGSSEDESLVRRLREENEVDLMIYRFAVDRFDREYGEMLKQLGAIAGRALSPEDSDGISEALEMHYRDRVKRRVRPSNRVHFTFDRAVHDPGWHAAEFLGGLPYRWTGPDDVAELDLALLSGDDYHLECLMPVSVSEEMSASLRVECNGRELLTTRRSRNGLTRIGASIPAAALDPSHPVVRLTFRTATPEKVPGDDRRLGISLAWILILPESVHEQVADADAGTLGW